MEKFEKIFSPFNLLLLNIFIIILVTISGSFFVDTGLIHAIAIFFIALSVVRIFSTYYSYDQFLEKFFHMTMMAFLIFGLSHLVEFFSYKVLGLADEVTFLNVVNFYIIALLLLSIGAERFLRKYDRRKGYLLWSLGIVALAFMVPIVGLYLKSDLISLELDEIDVYVYVFLCICAALVAVWKINSLGKLVSISSNFTKYINYAVVLITLSILVDVLYEALEHSFQNYQIIYLSHFLFYGGMTLIFLAFGTLAEIKNMGIYKEAQKELEQVGNK